MTQIRRVPYITRNMVRANPNVIFVFGDNMEGRGWGGQAGAMRGEPNAVGIPTKWKPERTPEAYFTDEDFKDKNVRYAIYEAFKLIEDSLINGKSVVIPASGVGGGLAELPQRAPTIYKFIQARFKQLEETFS